MRNPSFPLRSPQSGCSPAGSEGTPKRKDTKEGQRQNSAFIPPFLFSFWEKQPLTLLYSLLRSFFSISDIWQQRENFLIVLAVILLIVWLLNTSCEHGIVCCHHSAVTGFVLSFLHIFYKETFFYLVLFLHSGLSSPTDSAVTSSLCTLTKGWRT